MNRQILKSEDISNAIYRISFGKEITLAHLSFVDEGTIDGIQCEIWEYSYNAPTILLYFNGLLLRDLGGRKWYIKDTSDIKRWEFCLAQTGMDVKWLIDKTYTSLDHGLPYWVGKTWYYDKLIQSIPQLVPPVINTMKTKVVGLEEIVVPAGIFNCYKIEYKTVKQNGAALKSPVPSCTIWRCVENEKIEVRSEYFTDGGLSRVEELLSYNW